MHAECQKTWRVAATLKADLETETLAAAQLIGPLGVHVSKRRQPWSWTLFRIAAEREGAA